MPWWSWFLIWGALVLAFLGMLVWSAVGLYRKARRVLRALGDVTDQVAALELAADVSAPVPQHLAVFADPEELHHNAQRHRADREHHRQLRRDARIVRGKLLRNARYVTR
ncbi:hypothetical protein [Cryobacterium sp. Y11]|jgi:HAMP domain-containing protein|uniref:hypothetical protein n=1 Tax=Cryobacterium sp. Y11 TaxID=2045016 RepID=UPI000CE34158|nr:hypothetical protein [Cryobacterium sp. Y11]